MWEVVSNWDVSTQVWTLVAAMFFTTVIAVKLLDTIKIILRGYPSECEEAQDCDHDDNITGGCLKIGGCKTTQECNATIEKHKGGE